MKTRPILMNGPMTRSTLLSVLTPRQSRETVVRRVAATARDLHKVDRNHGRASLSLAGLAGFVFFGVCDARRDRGSV